jgi:hypothetical protein
MPQSHIDPRPALAATISPLVSSRTCADTRAALEWLGAAGYRGVQLSATDPETRPRELSMSARRDLAATMTRLELACSGIDLFIPPAHFADPSHMARAFEATEAAIEFAGMLGRVPVTLPLGPRDAGEFLSAITAVATRHGVDILLPIVEPSEIEMLSPPCAASIDCAAVLARRSHGLEESDLSISEERGSALPSSSLASRASTRSPFGSRSTPSRSREVPSWTRASGRSPPRAWLPRFRAGPRSCAAKCAESPRIRVVCPIPQRRRLPHEGDC